MYESNHNNYSLYTGLIGIAYCYFLLAEQYNHKRNITIANMLIKNTIANFDQINSFTFSKGLLGIGWGIETISQNGYCSIETDKILYDFDDIIYKQSCFYRSASLSLENGALGKGLCFYQRILSNTSSYITNRMLLNRECLSILIDEVIFFTNDILKKGLLITREESILISQSLLFLYNIYRKGIIINECPHVTNQ